MDLEKIQTLIREKKYSELAYLISKEIFASAELANVEKSELIIYKHALFMCPALPYQIGIDASIEEIEAWLKRFIKRNIHLVLHTKMIYPSEFES